MRWNAAVGRVFTSCLLMTLFISFNVKSSVNKRLPLRPRTRASLVSWVPYYHTKNEDAHMAWLAIEILWAATA
jgi:hypothetical protein